MLGPSKYSSLLPTRATLKAGKIAKESNGSSLMVGWCGEPTQKKKTNLHKKQKQKKKGCASVCEQLAIDS
jgi:hypothetical protein